MIGRLNDNEVPNITSPKVLVIKSPLPSKAFTYMPLRAHGTYQNPSAFFFVFLCTPQFKFSDQWFDLGAQQWKSWVLTIEPPGNSLSCFKLTIWLIRKDPDDGKDWRQEKKGMTGQDGWMASPTQWTWVWASSGRWWRTGKPGVLQSMGLQRVRHAWVTEQQQIQP